MTGKAKRRKVPGILRSVLARNIGERLDAVYPTSANQDKALATAAGVSLSTIQRIRKAEVGASIDNIEDIAKALRTSVTSLLTPLARGSEFSIRARAGTGRRRGAAHPANRTCGAAEPPATPPGQGMKRQPPFSLVSDLLSPETLKALEGLAQDAREGELIGFAYVAMYRRREYTASATGEARRNPTFARGMLAALDDYLADIVGR